MKLILIIHPGQTREHLTDHGFSSPFSGLPHCEPPTQLDKTPLQSGQPTPANVWNPTEWLEHWTIPMID